MFRLLLSQVSYAEAAKLSKKVGPFLECSAKTGENLRLVFQEAVRTAINKPKTKPRNCNLLWKSKKRKKYDWNQFTQIRFCANISIKIDKYILFQCWSKFTWKSPVQFFRVQLFNCSILASDTSLNQFACLKNDVFEKQQPSTIKSQYLNCGRRPWILVSQVISSHLLSKPDKLQVSFLSSGVVGWLNCRWIYLFNYQAAEFTSSLQTGVYLISFIISWYRVLVFFFTFNWNE